MDKDTMYYIEMEVRTTIIHTLMLEMEDLTSAQLTSCENTTTIYYSAILMIEQLQAIKAKAFELLERDTNDK